MNILAMRRNYFLTAMLLGLVACGLPVNPNKEPEIKPTVSPIPSSTPINISNREQRITSRQSTGNYRTIPLSISVGTDLYITLNAATAEFVRSIKNNDDTKLKFISSEKNAEARNETWVFKTTEKGEFELSFQISQKTNQEVKYESAEIFKMNIR